MAQPQNTLPTQGVLIAADGIDDQGMYDDILHLAGNANSNAIAT